MLKFSLIGYLGKDAVVNNANGKSVINFSVAHSEKVKDAQGNSNDKTVWVECAYWTEKVAIAPYLKKGTQVYVEGNGDLKVFGKKDGTSGSGLTCRVSTIQLLGNKEEQTQAPQSATNNGGTRQTNVNPSELTEPVDDLPF